MDVTLYTWSACKHCETARGILRERGIEFAEYALDADRELKRRLADELGRADMPYARVDGELLGGVAALRDRLASEAD
ncbi:MAG: glutaredoxin [Planctomycetes bacterium]|nr:glutaredoxin [Planctomycetota bacterium]MCB9902843.1 glutaredoxin [Planctomycetota bacterium]